MMTEREKRVYIEKILNGCRDALLRRVPKLSDANDKLALLNTIQGFVPDYLAHEVQKYAHRLYGK